ncbi:MAG: PIN domain-containing protein [Deltaproteobacteria bacterium]|nr:PIN domain-containing protein [Deltaproteobacteria bacterium]
MRVLFDTNVVLDLLLDREPFSTLAAQLFSRVEAGRISGYVCATTVTTVHYLASKAVGTERALLQINDVLTLFEIAPVNRAVLESALASKFADFEDAVLHEAALHVDAVGIVTRDPHGFKRAEIPVYSPQELAQILRAGEEASR